MAREYKNAGIICIAISIIAVLGIFLGIKFNKPLIIALVMLPAVIYEVYRTEGVYTKIASWLSLTVVVAEAYVIIAGITIDLSPILGESLKSFSITGRVHAGLIGPVALVILALYLFKNTAGIYTRWLSIIILVSSIALFYAINPEIILGLLQSSDIKESIKKGVQNKIR